MRHGTRQIWDQLVDLAYDCFYGFRPNPGNRHVQAEIARTLGHLLRHSQRELTMAESGDCLFPNLDRSRRCLAELGLILRIGRGLDAVTPQSFRLLQDRIRGIRVLLGPGQAKAVPEKLHRRMPRIADRTVRIVEERR